jgi:hypothetical protein
MKRRKSSKTCTRITALKILKTNIKSCVKEESLNKLQRVRRVYSLLNKYRKIIIPIKDSIKLNHYIQFLNTIPDELFSDKPIFYYENNKWDSLGLLGERTHRSTIRTKYLQLCFRVAGLEITRVLDNEVDLFKEYKTEKKRFLAALYYVGEKVTNKELAQILTKAIKLSDERLLHEQSGRGNNSNRRKSLWSF